MWYIDWLSVRNPQAKTNYNWNLTTIHRFLQLIFFPCNHKYYLKIILVLCIIISRFLWAFYYYESKLCFEGMLQETRKKQLKIKKEIN